MKAVQILSRLNRFCKGKIDTYVLDFVNTAEGIAASFKPFFEDTLLTEIVAPNLVYRYKTDIDKLKFILEVRKKHSV